MIAGNGVGSNGKYRGVAPGAALVGLKVLDANGAGRTSDVLSAIEYAVTNRDALGLRVLNLSLGHPIFEPARSRSVGPGGRGGGALRPDRGRLGG